MRHRLGFFALLLLASGTAIAQMEPETAPEAETIEAVAAEETSESADTFDREVAQPATTGAPLPRAVPVPAEIPMRKFICSDGANAELVEQPAAGVLRVTRLGESFALFQTVGANPPRYVAREGTLILPGDRAILIRPHHKPVRCDREPDAPIVGTLWGSIDKRDRSALPAGSKAKVLLVDVARADAPAVEIGSTEILTAGNQTPLQFFLRYDPNRIVPAAGRYALQARISDPKGRLLYVTDTHVPLFAEGLAQAALEVTVVPVKSGE